MVNPSSWSIRPSIRGCCTSENEIVPRLEKEVPHQPSAEQLAGDPWLHRFTLVFDREGYSPAFFLKMKQQRIACLSYHKYPGEDWLQEEFAPREVELASGETVSLWFD
jgi:hypothetical protein